MTPEQREALEHLARHEHTAQSEHYEREAIRALLDREDALQAQVDALTQEVGRLQHALVDQARLYSGLTKPEDRAALEKWRAWLNHFEPCSACQDADLYCPEWYRLQDEAVAATEGGAHDT